MMLKLFLGLTIWVLAFSLSGNAQAQSVCNPPPDYCIGTRLYESRVCRNIAGVCVTEGQGFVSTWGCDGQCRTWVPEWPCASSVPNPDGTCQIQNGPPTELTCCVNVNGDPGDCNNNGVCEDGENSGNCPIDCPPVSPAMCGQDCAPGGADCGSGGLSCASDYHCTAGDQYASQCSTPGGSCGPGGSCYRVCWGDVCGNGGGDTQTVSGSVYSSPDGQWNNIGVGITGVPIRIQNIEDPNNIREEVVTTVNGGYSLLGAVIGLGPGDKFNVIPEWTYLNPTDPYAPEGYTGHVRTIECDDDERCEGDWDTNMPTGSTAFINQRRAEFNPGVGLWYGDGCDAVHYQQGGNFENVGRGRREHCDFYLTPGASVNISGEIRLVRVDESNPDVCIDQGALNKADYEETVIVTYSPDTQPETWTDTIDSGNTYLLEDTEGLAGDLYVNRAVLNIEHPILETIEYRLACFNNRTDTLVGSTTHLEDFSTGDLTGQNFGYVLYNPYEDGWFTATNGTVYGQLIEAAVPPSSVPTGVDPYLASFDTGKTTAVMGNSIDVYTNPNRLVENRKYLGNFAGNLWPDEFNYEVPALALTNSRTNFNNMQTGNVYSITVSNLNTVLNSAVNYNLGGSAGIAVVYVTDPTNSGATINIRNLVRSQHTTRRILLITRNPVRFAKEIGVDVSGNTPINISTLRAHTEIGIISARNISFESNYNESAGTIDKVIVAEGPIISGTNENINTSITLSRNLGLFNTVYPAIVVRHNPLYLVYLSQNSGITKTEIHWEVKP